MPIKTIVRGYAIAVGLILMSAITIHMAVSLVERDPWVTLSNRPGAAPQEVASSDHPYVSEPITTRVKVNERPVSLDTKDQPSAADQQDAEFDRQAKQLALKFRTANSTEQEKLRQELESLCEVHFEYRQKQRKWEIEQLSNRVDSLRLTQVTRQANKTEILKRRLNDLLDPDTNLQWDSSKTKEEPNSAQIETRDPARELNITTNSAPSNTTDSPEPTYEGKTITQWLSLLKTERSQAKIKDALRALSHLSVDADPRTLVQAIIRMSRSQSDLSDNEEGQSQNILQFANAIFLEMPSNVVLDEFLTELNEIPPQKLSGGFKSMFTTFLVSIVQNGTVEVFRSNFYPRYYYFDKYNRDAFAGEIRQRSGEMVSFLTRFAQKDRSNDDWAIESAYYILGITEQPFTTYPDLIPVAERVFSNTTSIERKAISARMLGESGLHKQEVLGYVKETLRQMSFSKANPEVVIVQLANLAEKLPEIISIIADDLSESWKKFETAPDSQGGDCDDLIYILAKIGEPAKSVLPFLKTIVDTAAAQRASQKFSTPTLYALSQQRPLLHQDHILEAIKQIEEAKPKPKPEQSGPLLGLRLTDPIAKSSVSIRSTSTDPAPDVEKTFDGIAYSNWLKMLETERKPEKLATAMEACSRLADPRDEHAIARRIFLAAALFEKTGNWTDQQLVWRAGWEALQRLPEDVIVEELIVALQDDVSYKSGREFQGQLMAQKFLIALESFPKDRTEVLITELVNVIRKNGKGARSLLAGASNVWQNSKRPLSDFESLQSLMFKAVEDGPYDGNSGSNEVIDYEWKTIILNLIQGAPETPELAVKLMKHAGKSNEVVELIGTLGQNAEPAVPMLVDLFLEEWKLLEKERRDEANQDDHQRNIVNDPHYLSRCRIIQTIGEIGRGQNGYALLTQLSLIAPPKKERSGLFDGQFYDWVDGALAKFAPDPPSEPNHNLLSDFTLITGRWRLQTLIPADALKGATAEFRTDAYMVLYDNNNQFIHFKEGSHGYSGYYFELNATKSPKQISIFKIHQSSEIPGTRREGIYELTETVLRIQLSEPGQPRPTALVTEKAKLPKDHYLLECERSLDDRLTKKTTATVSIDPTPVADPVPVTVPALVVEKTFDGIPYSNWLKMLETERKPEKLATGMEACSRLADPRDEHRIAQGIFLAAGLFETGDEKEQQLVWNAGWTALQRLPADVIAEELILALQDEVSYKSGREFQGKLIAQKVSNAFESFPKDRTEVLITELVNVIQKNGKGTGLLLAGASNVWRNSKRPLNDFESLQFLIFDAVESGPKITVNGTHDSIATAWKIIVSNLIKGAPETPDLAVRLMKHAGRSSEVVELIGKLGPHAEPAVPLLVELFLEEWKLVEAERRDEANHVYHQRSNDETFRHHFRRCQIVQTIGEIGRGQNGYALLRQLILIAPPKKDRDAQFDGQLFGRVDDALAKFVPEPQSEPKPDLLGDFTLITGRWRFQAMSPGEAPKGATAEFKRSYMQLEERDGTDFRFERNSQGFAGFRFELDETKSPKQISLFKYQPRSASASAGSDAPLTELPGTRMEGIYELTETTLKIQLNEPGQPRSTELVTDKTNRPKRQYLLEFDRSLDEKLTKTPTPSP